MTLPSICWPPYREQRATQHHPSCAWQFHSDSWRVSDRPGNRFAGIREERGGRGTFNPLVNFEPLSTLLHAFTFTLSFDSYRSIIVFRRIIFSTETCYTYRKKMFEIDCVRFVSTKTFVLLLLFIFFFSYFIHAWKIRQG